MTESEERLESSDVKLLHLIEESPALYDWSHRKFKNRDLKDRIWETIADEMGKSVSEVQRRFMSIKETMRRNKKKIEATTKFGQYPVITWPLWEAVQFLDPTKHRRLSIDGMHEKHDASSTIPGSNTSSSSVKRSLECASSFKPNKRKAGDTSNSLLLHATQVSEVPIDENELFGRSIAKTLSRLTKVRTAKLKMDICRLLLDAEIAEESANSK